MRISPLPADSALRCEFSASGGAFGAAPAHGSRWQVCDGPACKTRSFPEYTGRDPEDMRLVNHSFGDGPPVQSQTSASPLIADIFAPPWGPPGGEDCHSRRRRGSSACSVSRTGWALQKWVARIRPWHCTSEPVAGSRSATRTRQPDAHRDVTQDNPRKKSKKSKRC